MYEPLLLAEAGCAHLEKRLIGLPNGLFQRCRRPLPLLSVAQRVR